MFISVNTTQVHFREKEAFIYKTASTHQTLTGRKYSHVFLYLIYFTNITFFDYCALFIRMYDVFAMHKIVFKYYYYCYYYLYNQKLVSQTTKFGFNRPKQLVLYVKGSSTIFPQYLFTILLIINYFYSTFQVNSSFYL